MITNEILRDLNIKRTFKGVNLINEYPVELIKINIHFNFDNSKLDLLNKQVNIKLISNFISLVNSIFKKNPNNVQLLGFSPEYRINQEWFLPEFNFRFFIVGNKIHSKETEIKDIINKTMKSNIGGDYETLFKVVYDKEDLFFELYPNTMMDDVMKLLLHNDNENIVSKDSLELMANPILIKKRVDFISYFIN